MENIPIHERLSFTVEWYQEEAAMVRQFLLNYFPYDKTIEMFDKKKNKTFLKRVHIVDFNDKNLYIGAKLNIFGRIVTITGFENEYTRQKLLTQREIAFALIPPKNVPTLSEILKILCDNGFSISDCAMFELNRQQSDELVSTMGFGISEIWSAGPSVALIITGNDAFERLKELVAGPERQTNHNLKLIFGTGAMTDAVFHPSSPDDVPKVCDFFFPKSPATNKLNLATSFENSTLCIIKPHAMLEGKCGEIMMQIVDNGFVVKAMKMFNLSRQNCEEFYEVYNGVSPDYLKMVTELSSGPFIVLEIGLCDPIHPAYCRFRQLCGPSDPEIAREIRPKTIRARFGVNSVKNAVHCTDLEEDCLHEVEYFFRILAQ